MGVQSSFLCQYFKGFMRYLTAFCPLQFSAHSLKGFQLGSCLQNGLEPAPRRVDSENVQLNYTLRNSSPRSQVYCVYHHHQIVLEVWIANQKNKHKVLGAVSKPQSGFQQPDGPASGKQSLNKEQCLVRKPVSNQLNPVQ